MTRFSAYVRITIALMSVGCGDDSSGPAGPNMMDAGETAPDAGERDAGDAMPCEARSLARCDEDGACVRVEARRIATDASGPCLGEETIEGCRRFDVDCSDGDAVTYSCDAEGNVWQSPRTCVPAVHELCNWYPQNALAACDATGRFPTCGAPSTPAPGGCVRSSLLAPDEVDGDAGRLSITAEVVELGAGESYALCGSGYRVDMIDFGSDAAPRDDSVPFMRLRDDTGAETLVLLWNDSFPEVELGQRLKLAVSYRFEDVGPTLTTLTMRSEQDALIAWFSTASHLESLRPPSEVELTQGEASCIVYDWCVPYSENYALTFSVAGSEVRLAPGERAQVGAFTAFHGGLLSGDADPGCADAAESSAGAAVFRRTTP